MNLYTPTQALPFFSISMPATHISSAVIPSFLWELTPFLFKVTEWFLDDLPPFFRKSLKNFLFRTVGTKGSWGEKSPTFHRFWHE